MKNVFLHGALEEVWMTWRDYGNDEMEKLALKKKVVANFKMKDLVKLKYFLKIDVAYSKRGDFLIPKKMCTWSSEKQVSWVVEPQVPIE